MNQLDELLPSCPFGREISDSRLIWRGAGGMVWKVELAQSITAVLKQTDPEGSSESRCAADYLRWRDGAACVRLLDQVGNWVLMEWAGDKRLSDHLATSGDASATDIAADIIGRLHMPSASPCPDTLLPLREHFSALFAKAEADRRHGSETPYTKAGALAEGLLDAQRAIQPLHGDIHHDNVLFGERGWLAIDPKGVKGDPLFDTTNLFLNPQGDERRFSETRAAAMAENLAYALQRDIEQVLEWALAYCGLSAAWHLEDCQLDAVSDNLTIYRAIEAALAQVRA